VGWALASSTRATICFFTSAGKAYSLRADDLPSTTGYGDPIQKLFDFKDKEKVVGVIALDERGKTLASGDFATLLGRWRDDGVGDLAFAIGGAGGLDASVREAAALTLALGPMTWPHLLTRALLAEQLYRAQSILTGHPYHRE